MKINSLLTKNFEMILKRIQRKDGFINIDKYEEILDQMEKINLKRNYLV